MCVCGGGGGGGGGWGGGGSRDGDVGGKGPLQLKKNVFPRNTTTIQEIEEETGMQ